MQLPLIVLLVVFAFAMPHKAPGQPQPLQVVVSIRPQIDLVERIGGEHVKVHCLLSPGQSHGVYEPTPRDLAILTKADLFLGVGIPFEKHVVEKVRKVVAHLDYRNLAENLPLRPEEGVHHHAHCAGGDVCAGAQDPHIWLGPSHIKRLIDAICRELTGKRPQFSAFFQARADIFLTELEALHSRFLEQLKPFRGRSVMVFHPAYGYFLDEFGLRQIAIEFEGKEPSPRELVRLIRLARQEKISTLFSQPQFSGRSVTAIAEAISARIVTIDPMPDHILPLLASFTESLVEAMRSDN